LDLVRHSLRIVVARLALVALLAAAMAVVGFASVANAGTVSKVGATYVYDAGVADAAGQSGLIYHCVGACGLTDAQDSFLITESGGSGAPPTVAGGSGCAVWAPNPAWVKCPSAGMTAWEISLRGGNDALTAADTFGPMVPVTVDGSDGSDSITTASAADSIRGGPGSDTLFAGEGNDTLDGGLDNDSINGGGSTDVVSYAGRSDGVAVNLAGPGADDGSANDGLPGSRDTILNVEGIIGTEGGDNLDGSSSPAHLTIEGRGGGDRIRGGSGGNTLRGEGGNDDLGGGGDPDLLEGGDGNDTLDGLAGADTVRGGSGFDTIEARDAIAEDVDCGPDDDSAFTDAVDIRINCDPAPTPIGPVPAGPTPIDRTPPKWSFSAAKAQRALKKKSIILAVKPNEACALTVTAKLGKKKLGTAKKALTANRKATVKIKLKKKSLAAVRKALRRRKTVAATLSIKCVDLAGNAGTAKKKIKLKR